MRLDGVEYRSSLGERHNVALFDLNATVITSGFVTHVGGMKLDLDDPSDGYDVSTPTPNACGRPEKRKIKIVSSTKGQTAHENLASQLRND
jgi:hypothetical protein